jgi:peptidoglycan/LPS O-acetylase OafA/YrhL
MNASLRGVLAVGVGLATIVVLSNGVDTVLELTGAFPSIAEQRRDGFHTPWMLATALGYRVVFAAIGGYVTARLAPSRPAAHIIALILVGCVLGLVGMVAAQPVTPMWFSVMLLVVTPPAVWAGSRLTARTERRPRVEVPA